MVHMQDGKSFKARKGVVVATDGPTAQSLLGKALTANPSKPEAGVGTCCLYFRSFSFCCSTSEFVVVEPSKVASTRSFSWQACSIRSAWKASPDIKAPKRSSIDSGPQDRWQP